MITTQAESLANIIKNMDSWENLVIGFECMVYKFQISIMSNFGTIFLIFLSKINSQKRIECYSCERLNQNLFNEILNI